MQTPPDFSPARIIGPLEALAIGDGRTSALPSILTTAVQPEPSADSATEPESESRHDAAAASD